MLSDRSVGYAYTLCERVMTALWVSRWHVSVGVQYESVCVAFHKSLLSADWSDPQQKVSSQAPFTASFVKELLWCVTLVFASTCLALRADECVSLMWF